MVKILLIAGHGAGDPGAVGSNTTEAAEARRVVNALVKPLQSNGLDVTVYDQNKNAFVEAQAGRLNFGGSFDYVFEVHFNSAVSNTSKGTEAYITTTESSDAVEQKIVSKLGKYFVNRGVKRMNFSVILQAKIQGMSSCLYEMCFINNPNDMVIYNNNFNSIINDIANAIAEGFGLNGNTTSPTPEKPKSQIIKRKHNQYNTVRPAQSGYAKPTNGLSYMVHLTKYGWGLLVESGQLAGSIGKGNTIEAINVLINGSKDWVTIEAHKAGSGWDKPKKGEGGSTGKGVRIEALKMSLNGELAKQYDLVYRVHQSTIGWSEWVKNGRQAGIVGQGKGIEAVEIKLVPK